MSVLQHLNSQFALVVVCIAFSFTSLLGASVGRGVCHLCRVVDTGQLRPSLDSEVPDMAGLPGLASPGELEVLVMSIMMAGIRIHDIRSSGSLSLVTLAAALHSLQASAALQHTAAARDEHPAAGENVINEINHHTHK